MLECKGSNASLEWLPSVKSCWYRISIQMFLRQLSKCLNHESINLLLLVEPQQIEKLKEWLMVVFTPADNSSNQRILHCLALLKVKDSLIVVKRVSSQV